MRHALAHWMPEDPAPVDLTPKHPGFYAPHALRCGRMGCCKPIAWMTTDRRLPYLGNCEEHRVATETVPVTVYASFSEWPEDMRAYAARQVAAEIARLKGQAQQTQEAAA